MTPAAAATKAPTLKEISKAISTGRDRLGIVRDLVGTHGAYRRQGRTELESLELAARWARAAAAQSLEVEKLIWRRIEAKTS